MDPYIERSIAERASEQLGHINRPQLRELGVGPRAERRLVAGGLLIPAGNRTFRMGGVPRTFDGDVMAACLDVDGVASHRTAARLHGLDTTPWNPVPIEVTVRKARQATHSDLAIVHTSTSLGADDLTTVRRVPATGIARTIFGLAALVPEIAEDDVRNVLDVAVRDGRASDGWLCWRLAELRCRGRNGVTVLEAILADREGKGRTESWLERAFLRLIEAAGFPLPKVQRRIAAPGRPTSRVDFLYEPTVVIEVTGHGGHSTQRQRRADAQRRNRLQALGFDVVEFTYEMVRRNPGYVLATVAEHAGFTVPVLDLAALTAKPF